MDEDSYLAIGVATTLFLIFLCCVSLLIRYYLKYTFSNNTNEYRQVASSTLLENDININKN